jgi:hypothetical protein
MMLDQRTARNQMAQLVLNPNWEVTFEKLRAASIGLAYNSVFSAHKRYDIVRDLSQLQVLICPQLPQWQVLQIAKTRIKQIEYSRMSAPSVALDLQSSKRSAAKSSTLKPCSKLLLRVPKALTKNSQ